MNERNIFKYITYLCKSYKLDFINHFIIKNMIGKKRDRYRKMPLKIKILFLKRVIEEGQSIKKVKNKLFRFLLNIRSIIRQQRPSYGMKN